MIYQIRSVVIQSILFVLLTTTHIWYKPDVSNWFMVKLYVLIKRLIISQTTGYFSFRHYTTSYPDRREDDSRVTINIQEEFFATGSDWFYLCTSNQEKAIEL